METFQKSNENKSRDDFQIKITLPFCREGEKSPKKNNLIKKSINSF